MCKGELGEERSPELRNEHDQMRKLRNEPNRHGRASVTNWGIKAGVQQTEKNNQLNGEERCERVTKEERMTKEGIEGEEGGERTADEVGGGTNEEGDGRRRGRG